MGGYIEVRPGGEEMQEMLICTTTLIVLSGYCERHVSYLDYIALGPGA